jgi:UDP:flavonoid glycosyltransferase YjiC (YdhE family)
VVSIGFGSLASEDPAALTALVLAAVRRAGVRAALLSGWGGLSAQAEGGDVYCADALPHAWLFPRMAATVHHGEGARARATALGEALRAEDGVAAAVARFPSI